MNEKDPRVEVFFVSTIFLYLDTSKTSTGVGKEEAKKDSLVNLLARHISSLYKCRTCVKLLSVDERKTCGYSGFMSNRSFAGIIISSSILRGAIR